MWNKYVKTSACEMRPYEVGEDLTGISVAPEYVPKEGDMVARDINNHLDMWLISSEYFLAYYKYYGD